MADTTIEPKESTTTPEGEERMASLRLNLRYTVLPDGTVVFNGGTVSAAKEAADEKLVGQEQNNL